MRTITNFPRTLTLKSKQFRFLLPLKIFEVFIQTVLSKVSVHYKFYEIINKYMYVRYPLIEDEIYDLSVPLIDDSSYPIFGKYVNILDDDDNIIWNRDFFFGHDYYDKKINLGISDIKIPWEIGRFSYFAKLSSTNNIDIEQQKLLFEKYIYSFINQNSDTSRSVQWCNAMEAGIRITNILITYSNYKSRGCSFTENFEQTIYSLTLMHRKYILLNLEYSVFQTSNHLIANIMGLIAIYSHYDFKMRRLILKALQVFLLSELNRNLRDGFWGEGSSAYHRFTSEMVAFMYFQLNIFFKSDSKLEKIKDLVYKMYVVSMELENPLGCHSLVGDSDGGSFNFLCLFEYMIGDCSSKSPYNLKYYTDYMSRILGVDKIPLYYPIQKRPQNKSYQKHFQILNFQGEFAPFEVLENPNYVVLRSANFYICLSRMQSDNLYNLTHFHDDAGLVELFVNNEVVLIDSGTYSYTGTPQRKLEETSRESHIHKHGFVAAKKGDIFTLQERHNSFITILKLSENEIQVTVNTEQHDLKITARSNLLTIAFTQRVSIPKKMVWNYQYLSECSFGH